ncbi:protein of unknown function [Azospirillum lipoferum 4B]|uniref:Uncharacterized protein n=1 Tax=Azospirillum lipoferum (strain 4B) TaxID=862719 RepID=G7Z5U9_AZOL4|nr:protein of unknown function [Azospirillum lipoferum 4B]
MTGLHGVWLLTAAIPLSPPGRGQGEGVPFAGRFSQRIHLTQPSPHYRRTNGPPVAPAQTLFARQRGGEGLC